MVPQYNLDSQFSRVYFHLKISKTRSGFSSSPEIMKAIQITIFERSNSMKKNQNFEPVSITKKLRSKIPRRKRFQISPILCESSSNSLYGKPKDEVSSVLIPDEISCTSNLISVGSETLQEFKLSLKKKRKKKQVVVSETENSSDDRRIITRSYCKKVSESNSCGVVFTGDEFSGRKDEEGNYNVSEAISETSCVQSVYSSKQKSRKKIRSEEEFTGDNDSAKKKAKVEIQGDDNNNVSEITYVSKSDCKFASDEIRDPESSISDLSRNYCKIESNLEFTGNDSTKKAKEEIQGDDDNVSGISFVSKAISNSELKNQNQFAGDEIRAPVASISSIIQIPSDTESDCKLVSSEELSYDTEESTDYSNTITKLDSEFSTGSSLFDSESQTDFSQGSPGSTAYFSFLTQYSNEFSRLRSSVVSSDYKVSPQINQDYLHRLTYLRFEDENDEDSYKDFRSRERNRVIPCNYIEEYYSTTSHGNLILQQRQSIVHWITDESDGRQLNLETVFLSVSLLDRFLSQGFFENKKKLQLLGIACLTLAMRIEENQTVSWFSARQKTFQIGNDVYSRCEVVAMEWLIQKVLNFQCILPTTHNFLWFYLKAARANEEMDDRAKYLAVLSLMDPDLLCYWPSTIAAGLVILSALTSNQDSSCQYIMETHIRTNKDDLPECIASLEWLVEYLS